MSEMSYKGSNIKDLFTSLWCYGKVGPSRKQMDHQGYVLEELTQTLISWQLSLSFTVTTRISCYTYIYQDLLCHHKPKTLDLND